ncbi:MAG: slipin family protein [Paludibacter sp.]|jgi:regulator of protease activity HflC (stomatin/prohibitin superfamily)|nr:slipin family protein [Paludibacter sp.]
METYKKKIQVKPNTVGYLFRNNVFEQKLNSGVYTFWDFKNQLELFCLPLTRKMLNITNQEVLTKDNIAFRFSFYLTYRIVDGEKFLSQFSLDKNVNYIIGEAEQRIWNLAQLHVKNIIVNYESEELNDKRSELSGLKKEDLNKQVLDYGIEIEEIEIKDLTFPKSIQDLFSKHLEAKIRAKSDLENARTAVATARTLKNASELMKDDDNIRFFQMIETISKIAEKGKHTFMIGDLNQFGTKK